MDGPRSHTAASGSLAPGDEPGRVRPFPGSWAIPSARCLPVSSSDQVWLEELVGSLSHRLPFSPSPSARSSGSSPGASVVGSQGTGSADSWSSGTTGLLHNSVKRQSQRALRLDRGWGGWDEQAALAPAGFLCGTARRLWRQGGAGLRDEGTDEGGVRQGQGSCVEDKPGAGCVDGPPRRTQLEQKIEAKLEFSRFLDEVTCSVLDPVSLQAFGQSIGPLSKSKSGLRPGTTRTTIAQPEAAAGIPFQSSPGLCRHLAQQQQQQQGTRLPTEQMQAGQGLAETTRKSFLETDVDSIGRRDEPRPSGRPAKTGMTSRRPGAAEDRATRPPWVFGRGVGLKEKSAFPRAPPGSGFWRYPCRSVSLPRGINVVSHMAYMTYMPS
ncbi:hypothetical protein NHX12_026390 [Muraenolepis orangiensis]|uniref:Uncharacterized protein n=1 Tax=Muraenolepis orangiensis TaxID=630683 RepID=A0A9Q0EM67_9TELE|nr:hypothetical protein NHX12_026390 [Muraenolepis orangiensis]